MPSFSLFPPLSSSSSSPLSSLLGDIRNRLNFTSTSLKFTLLCLLWYLSSALSNNSAKQILIVFKYPVTLVFVQFAFIAGWCMLLAFVQKLRGRNSRALFGAKHGIRYPTREIIVTTLPLSCFQIGGHIFGNLATSEIPVSVVHTVKVSPPRLLSLVRVVLIAPRLCRRYSRSLRIGSCLTCRIRLRRIYHFYH